jgi:hypothetical protein
MPDIHQPPRQPAQRANSSHKKPLRPETNITYTLSDNLHKQQTEQANKGPNRPLKF